MKKPVFFHNPHVLLTLGAVAISFSGVWVEIADVPADSSAFYRVFFGFLFLLVISLQSRIKIIPQKEHLLLGILCGVLFALDLFCWHRSILLIGPGLATILGNFQVFILAGIGIFLLREKYSRLLILAIPLAVAGLFLIIGFDERQIRENYTLGIYYGLATAVLYAAYILSLKQLSSKCSEKYQAMLLASFFTAVVLGLAILATDTSFVIPDAGSLISLVSLGFFSQCLGWLLIASSLPKTDTSRAGLILLLQPALSFVWDVLFFARPTTLVNWVGVVVTLSAIYIGLRSRKQPIAVNR